jgi:hypothetical protein
MSYSTLVVNPDNCYICNDFDELKYLGPIIFNKYYYYWSNYKYKLILVESDIELNNEKIYRVTTLNRSIPIPDNTEILLIQINNLTYIKKLPEGLKVLCCLNNFIYEGCITEFNLPIGLKYLCLNPNLDFDIVNRIKIPFGCKIIFFNKNYYENKLEIFI